MTKNDGLRFVWTTLAATAAIGFGLGLYEGRWGCFVVASLAAYIGWLIAKETKL